MMKLRVVIVFALLAGFTLTAHPALAYIERETCKEHPGPDGAGGDHITVCVTLQNRDCCFGDTGDVRALISWDCQNCRPEIRVRSSDLQYHPVGELGWNTKAHAEHMSWVWTRNTNQLAETAWRDVCPDSKDRYRRAWGEYQLSWYGDVTGWFEFSSGSILEHC